MHAGARDASGNCVSAMTDTAELCCLLEVVARSQDPAAGGGGRAGEQRQHAIRTMMLPGAQVPCCVLAARQNFTCFPNSLLPFTAAVISFGNMFFKDFCKKSVSCASNFSV